MTTTQHRHHTTTEGPAATTPHSSAADWGDRVSEPTTATPFGDPGPPPATARQAVIDMAEAGVVRNKTAHIAVGVDLDGIKHLLLGIWVQTTEGAKFWAGVCAEPRVDFLVETNPSGKDPALHRTTRQA